MKIITINVNKGGAGKTTVAHNFAEYLAKDSRVLLMDFDDSANLTHRYGEFDKSENTVIGLFETGKVTPVNVTAKEQKSLSLIAGHQEVEVLKERLNTRRRREYIFGKWLAENIEQLEKDYDYMVIDTENDEGILTVNALLVSDVVLGIAEASKDSVTALARLREFVDDINHDFESDIHLYFIGNKINLSEKASNDLLTALNNFDGYLGYLPRRTLLADDVTIFNSDNPKAAETVAQVTEVFDKIKEKLEEA
ncbi:MAG: ParA family protein [Streptococcaceae bacterium]|jgi:chromosome partitioning protein|nr:ParA family protein [Streptococcaceae bacterium]